MDELVNKQAVLDLYEKYKPYMAVKTHEFGARLKALPSADEYEIVKEYCHSRCLALVDLNYLYYLSNGTIVPHKQKWIPCSERLPERKEPSQMRGYYLTTNSYGAVSLTKYEFERESFGFVGWDSDIQIVAWMPLPIPYKESEDKE